MLGVVLSVGVGIWFWPLLKGLPSRFLSGDGYYSHGFIVPLLSGYIAFKSWPRIRHIPVRAGWFALVPLAGLLYVVAIANRMDAFLVQSVGLIGALLLSTWFVAGWRWMFALFWPISYLIFALPVWTMAIDSYTYPLQRISTQLAYYMLEWSGFNPLQDGETIIHLNRFVLDVDVPCSGFKLLLAVAAFVTLFVLVGRLRWWANAILVAMAVPLSLFINGLRIALVGVVGDSYGRDAGIAFHDYSGYITLLLCFFIFFKTARLLGWKD